MTDSGGVRRRSTTRLAAVAAAAALVAACGSGGDDDARSATTTDAPTTATTDAPPAPSTSEPAVLDSAPATTPPSTGAPTSTSPVPNGAAPAFAPVDDIVTDHIAERGLNGAGLVVLDPELGVVHEDYWGVFGPDRVSLIASSSKMIAAGVVLALDDRGALDVDAPVADVVDWGDAHPDVTPAQLVSNSSGLPGLAQGLTILPYLCQFLPLGDLEGCAETIFTTGADDEAVIPPDTEFRYGGAQWQVAGAVAEIAGGAGWNELVDDVYEACAVDSLEFTNQWTQFGSIDFSYPDRFDGDPSTVAATANPNIEGGAYITPPDYGALLLMLLRDGRCGDDQVLRPESVERMLADRIGEVYGGSDGDSDRGYAMGWFVDRASGRRVDPGAYGSVAWIDPATDHAAYLVVESTGDDGDDLAAELFDVVETAVLETRNTVGG